MTKIYLRNQGNFHPETVCFYQENFELVPEDDAEIVVINDFEPIETEKVVAINATCPDNVKAPEIIKLEPETGELDDIVAVPELTLWAMLELVRKRGGQELNGKVLGIVGYGRISKLVKKRAESFGMEIIYYDTKELDRLFPKKFIDLFKTTPRGLYCLDLLLANSDIVSLNITASEDNRNFMDRAKFEQMKCGSYFLNSSRGWLVDNNALKDALASGKLAGAWSDFPTGFENPNLLITNHIAGSTLESKQKTEMIIARKVLSLSVK